MEETLTGADFIINNQNLEEAEELEERKRRDEKLQNLLANEMDDYNFDDDEDELQGGVDEQYRQAEPQDQLKVLYGVRCQEIAVSNSEVEKLQMEFSEQEQQLKKKILLLEYENNCKNVSLKEAQRLLADQTEDIKTMAAQIAKLENAAKSYESNIAELKEEGAVLREINMKYERDLVLLERGFPLKAGVADKEVHEALRAKVAQLESSLQTTSEEKDHMESQLKGTVKELHQYIDEQAKILIQKDVQLSTLNENYNSIQQQHQELLKTVEEMKRAKATGSPLQEELRKIRENNDHLKQDLTMRPKRNESAELEDRLKDLQKHVSSKANTVMVDEVVQVSLGMDQKESDRFKKVQENLYNSVINMFRTMDMSQQNALLKERERQIKCLQEKVAGLEKLLLQKHGRLTSSVGINTNHQELHEDASVLKIKYKTLKLQTEADEFDVKLEKVMSRTAEELRHQSCVKCPELELEMKKLHEMRKEDRISLVRMVEMWRDKCSQLEDDLRARDEQHDTIFKVEQKFKKKSIKVTQQMEEKFANVVENEKKRDSTNPFAAPQPTVYEAAKK